MPKSRRKTSVPNPIAEPTTTQAIVLTPEIRGNGDAEPERDVAPGWWEIEPETTTPPTLRTAISWLTLEVVVYAAIFLLAVYLRLVGLDTRPLSPAEAQTASAAWQYLQGQAGATYSGPFLFTLDWLAFFASVASDLSARFLPAVLGTLVVFVPLLARRKLGRGAAIVAALFLALSPTIVYFARTISGADIAAGAALASLIWFWRYPENHQPRELHLGAAAAGIALSTAPIAFTIFAAGALLAVVTRLLKMRAKSDDASDEEPDASAQDLDTGPSWRDNSYIRAAVLFAAVYIASATTFLLNRDGLGVAFNLFGTWLNSLSAVGPISSPLNLLLVYEPIPLMFGIAGIVLAFSQRRQDGQALSFLWLLGALGLIALVWYSIAGVKQPSDVVAGVLPFSLVAGWFIANLLERAIQDIRATGGWRTVATGEMPIFFMLVVLTALIYLQVVTFLQTTRFSQAIDPIYKVFGGSAQEPSLALAAFVLALITIIILAVYAGLSIMLVGVPRTTTLAALAILFLLTLSSLRATYLLNYSDVEPLPELVTQAQTLRQVRDLVKDLEFQSQARVGDRHEIRLAADQALGAVGQWYLRQFPNAVWSSTPGSVRNVRAVVALSDTPPNGKWMGTRYRLTTEWSLTGLGGFDLWKWLIFRQGGGETTQTATLWLQVQE